MTRFGQKTNLTLFNTSVNKKCPYITKTIQYNIKDKIYI